MAKAKGSVRVRKIAAGAAHGKGVGLPPNLHIPATTIRVACGERGGATHLVDIAVVREVFKGGARQTTQHDVAKALRRLARFVDGLEGADVSSGVVAVGLRLRGPVGPPSPGR